MDSLFAVLEDRCEELRQQLETAVGLDVTDVEFHIDAVDFADLILPGEIHQIAGLPVAHVREPW